MPRATKEKTDKLTKEKVEKTNKKTTSSKTGSKKNTNKSTSTRKTNKVTSTKNDTKKATTKKATTKKTTSTKRTTTTSPKKNTRNVASKKTVSKTSRTSRKKEQLLPEYYDLPYKYNQTIVKILAQTPTRLFVYWEISDDDRNNFINNYGDDFFNVTKPVLIIHNLTMNYSFEIDINDYANCWYLNINDADCYYGIELGRRPFSLTEKIRDEYIYVSSSNNLQTPNNHILFENINSNTVLKFKDVKTKNTSVKPLANLHFFANANKIYNNFYNLYKEFYGENLLKEFNDTKLNNPSSGAISSFK